MSEQLSDFQMILAVNPGSTSTKIAVYRGKEQLFLKTVRHSEDELKAFPNIIRQFSFRKKIILDELKLAEISLDALSAVIGRGGMVKPIPSGIYLVNFKMMRDLSACRYGMHASNLGGIIAYDIARELPDAKAYIADPVVVDEFDEVARISGHPLFERKSILHALNQKAVARQHAAIRNESYENMQLIVAHMGGGITVGAHSFGRIIDVNQGLDGEGPFSPQRSGTLPVGELVRLCFSGEYTKDEILKMITGHGGFMAYFGTHNAIEVERRADNGDPMAIVVQEALCYQVAKEIGAMSTVLNGEAEAILLTGGLAHSRTITTKIKNRIKHLAEVCIYPGEDEMQALAYNALRVLNNEIKAMKYE